MLLVYIGTYTLALAIIWGFFIVAKIHAYKFKNFSNSIEKVTNTLFIVLVILSIIGFVLIFMLDTGDSKIHSVDTSSENKYKDSVY